MIDPRVKAGPPAGYTKLPNNARCRCVKLWTDGVDHYCCKASELGMAAPPPLAKPTEYRVKKTNDGYEIWKDCELVGFDTRRQDANGTAASLEAYDRQHGREAFHYPCYED